MNSGNKIIMETKKHTNKANRCLLRHGYKFLFVALAIIVGACEKDDPGSGEPAKEPSSRPSNIPYLNSIDEGLPSETDAFVSKTIPQEDFSILKLRFTDYGGLSIPIRKAIISATYTVPNPPSGISIRKLQEEMIPENELTDFYAEPDQSQNFTSATHTLIDINQDDTENPGALVQPRWFLKAMIKHKETGEVWIKENYADVLQIASYDYRPYLDNPLTIKPIYLQISRKYKKIAQVTVSVHTAYQQKHIITTGTEFTKAQEFSKTIGLEVTAEAGASTPVFNASISATVSQSMTETFGTSFSLSKSETVERTFSCNSPESGDIVYAIWQAIEIIEYVDEDGNLWTAPDGYEVNSTLRMENLTHDYVQTFDYFE